MEDLQGTAGLETHKLHSNCVKVLYLLYILWSDLYLFTPNWVEGSNLVLIENRSGLIANVPLSVFQQLVVFRVHPLRSWLLGGYHSGVEAESNLSLRSQTEQALALGALPKLLLSNALHKLGNAVLSPLDAKEV
jgi:hypothetical protein